ncbi:hypothetical protein V6Z11_A13G044800 [Gossypium hirsutum]
MAFKKVETIFVQNIPMSIDKRWLWKVFHYYGRVCDIFIPQKKDSRRQRFGFFRFRRAGEARKAIQRLDGRTLRNYRIHVNMAKYRGRSAYWRNVTSNYDNYSCEIDSSLKTVRRGRCRRMRIVFRIIL